MLRPALLAVALAAAFPAHADSDLDALRAELKEMKASYETRIQALEARVQAAETKAAEAPQPAASAVPPVETAQAASNSFNPEVSFILQGGYAQLQDLPHRQATGFLSNGTAGPATRGFSVDDSELVLAANVDPYFRGYLNAVINNDTVGVEEAWFQTLALGEGLTLKGGRFRSGIGYQDEQHPHAWDFATNNLMYETLFGEGYSNDGLQLKWVAPTELFTELGAEIGRGSNFPGTDHNANGVGSYALYGHIGGDVGDSHSWRSGVSYLSTRAVDRNGTMADFSDTQVDITFNGDSHTWMADFVWKWAPHGNPNVNNFKFAAELFRREESGNLNCLGGLCGTTTGITGAYQATQYGGYAQAVYQFMPYWRVGYRYDLLNPGSPDYLGTSDLSHPGFKPSRHSLMVDYSPSEFTRLRLQYTRDLSIIGQDDNQWYVQYIFSLGTHGAHTF
jgi:hypothetical protein